MVKSVYCSKSHKFCSILNYWLNFDLPGNNNEKALRTRMKSIIFLGIFFRCMGYPQDSFNSFFEILDSVFIWKINLNPMWAYCLIFKTKSEKCGNELELNTVKQIIRPKPTNHWYDRNLYYHELFILGLATYLGLNVCTTSWVIRRCSIYAINCELRLFESRPLGRLISSSSSSAVQLSM